MDKTAKQQSFDLINQIYQPMVFLSLNESSAFMWKWSKLRAKEVARLIKQQIPQNTGELNPLWEFWNDVLIEIDKH